MRSSLIPLLSTVLLLVLLQLVVDCMGGQEQELEAKRRKDAEVVSKDNLETLGQCEKMARKNFESVRKLLEKKKNPDLVNKFRLKLAVFDAFHDVCEETQNAASGKDNTLSAVDLEEQQSRYAAGGGGGGSPRKQKMKPQKAVKEDHDFLKGLNVNGGWLTVLRSKQICEEMKAQKNDGKFTEEDVSKANAICAKLRAQIATFIRQNILPGHVVDTENIHGTIIDLIKEHFPVDHEKNKENSNIVVVDQIIKLIKENFPGHKDKANISGMINYLIDEHFPGYHEEKENSNSIADQIIDLIKENFDQENSAKSHGSPGRSPGRSPGQIPGQSPGRFGNFMQGMKGLIGQA